MSDLINKPGKYRGKLIDWAVTETRGGAPQIACMFEYVQDGKPLALTWYGSFLDTVIDRTDEVLKFLGFQGIDYSVLADGPDGKGLTLNAEALVTVETRLDLKGVMRAGISFVNDPTRATFTKKLDRAAASKAFERVSMRAKMKVDAQLAPVTAEYSENDLPY